MIVARGLGRGALGALVAAGLTLQIAPAQATPQSILSAGGYRLVEHQESQNKSLLAILEQDREFEEFLPYLLMAITDEI